ncbi:hypothetical protein FOZ63_024935, partial [Perkinsus olseni]
MDSSGSGQPYQLFHDSRPVPTGATATQSTMLAVSHSHHAGAVTPAEHPFEGKASTAAAAAAPYACCGFTASIAAGMDLQQQLLTVMIQMAFEE